MFPKQTHSLLTFLRQNQFAMLLVGLVSLFFYGAIIDLFMPRMTAPAIRMVVGAILGYSIIIASFVVARTSSYPRIVVVLAVGAILLEVLDVWLLRSDTQILSHGSGMLFIGYAIARILQHIFLSRRVTADTIFASLCVYMLFATLWTYAYSLLELFEPGAFSCSVMIDDLARPEVDPAILAADDQAKPANDESPKRIMRLGDEPIGIEFYYSLVTMTTLGYGEIVPVTSAARSLATLQAIVGQLYLAVLVARLVGMHVAESVRSSD